MNGFHFFVEILGGQWHRTETKGEPGGRPVECACGISNQDPRVLKLRGDDDDSWKWVPESQLGACFPEHMRKGNDPRIVHHTSKVSDVVYHIDGQRTDDWSKVTCPSCLRQHEDDLNDLTIVPSVQVYGTPSGLVRARPPLTSLPGPEQVAAAVQQASKENTMPPIPFTLTNENITIILDGKPVVVHAGTPQFAGLRDALFREDWAAVPQFASAAGALQQWLGDKFVVENKAISYEGVPLPDSLRNRIWAMVSKGESPGPLFRFYERLHKNPSFRSRTQLFDFMQHTGIPIEPDGTFLAYKGIKHDYTDGYTGTVDNSPGVTNKMPRNLISDDPDVACHYGYHVGALGYAGTFSQRTVVCRVDPEHVVCVPRDESAQKMRVCEYFVVGNHDGTTEMPSTTYTPDVDEGDDPDWGGDVEGEDQIEAEAANTAAKTAAAAFDDADDADFNGANFDEVENPDHNPDDANEDKPAKRKVVVTSKSTGPKAATFNRMKPAKLMEQSIDDLRKYASAHLKIIGASKMPGGKSALVSKILKVRRRRSRS